jgi:hypothetical protein
VLFTALVLMRSVLMTALAKYIMNPFMSPTPPQKWVPTIKQGR